MTKTMCALWLAAGVVIPGTPTHTLSATGEQTVPSPRQFIKTSDKQLREWAITSPPPEYPRTSLAKRVTGVVVAAVLFNEKGTTEAVDIIQSPDAETGSAVRDAVMQWKIKPIMAGLVAKATLAFYFHMKGRDGVVLNPAEMRGDQPWREERETRGRAAREADHRSGVSSAVNSVEHTAPRHSRSGHLRRGSREGRGEHPVRGGTPARPSRTAGGAPYRDRLPRPAGLVCHARALARVQRLRPSIDFAALSSPHILTRRLLQ